MKGIIFDCDGTLVDTEPIAFLAWQYALKKYDIEYFAEEHLQYSGFDGTTTLKKMNKDKGLDLSPEQFEDILVEKQKHFKEIRKQGVRPILEAVALAKAFGEKKEELGIKMAVASGDIKEHILENIESAGLGGVFDEVVSGHEDVAHYNDPEGTNKPKPYVYLEAAKRLGLKPSQCVTIEDSFSGVTSAVSAGVLTVAVPNELTKRQDFSQADFVLETLRGMTPEKFLEMVEDLLEE